MGGSDIAGDGASLVGRVARIQVHRGHPQQQSGSSFRLRRSAPICGADCDRPCYIRALVADDILDLNLEHHSQAHLRAASVGSVWETLRLIPFTNAGSWCQHTIGRGICFSENKSV